MIRKLALLLAALSMLASPLVVDAAQKKSVKSSISAKKVKSRVKHKLSAKKGKYIAHNLKSGIKTRGNKKWTQVSSKKAKYQLKHATYQPHAQMLGADNNDGLLRLASSKALVVNQLTGETIFAKNTSAVTPIASVTKLMTAMVALDAGLALDEYITITDEDVDMLKGTSSRLHVGTSVTRGELLQLAIMASENRAAAAIGRSYPGGTASFVRAMNKKAADIGMRNSYFVDSSGLNSANVSTAEDLVKMVKAAYQYDQIRHLSTQPSYELFAPGYSYPLNFVNTNGLVRNSDWVIGLSKTGFISEAGRCLVMQAEIAGKPMIIVLLDSVGKNTRIGDAQRIRKWVEENMQDADDNGLVFEKTLG